MSYMPKMQWFQATCSAHVNSRKVRRCAGNRATAAHLPRRIVAVSERFAGWLLPISLLSTTLAHVGVVEDFCCCGSLNKNQCGRKKKISGQLPLRPPRCHFCFLSWELNPSLSSILYKLHPHSIAWASVFSIFTTVSPYCSESLQHRLANPSIRRKMSSLLPVAVYGLEVPPGEILIPAAMDFPATVCIPPW